MSDELRLLLFALYKQATQGPCNEPKPWSWNVIETAKWQGWNQLGTISKAEAMRHYVHQLEQNQSNWWCIPGRLQEKEQQEVVETDTADVENKEATENRQARQKRIKEATSEGSWSTPYLSDAAKPLPRYEHGVAYVNEEMFVIGGNCGNPLLPSMNTVGCVAGGRYMNDVWTFDFTSLTWTCIACRPDTDDAESVLPPIAGHSLVYWKKAMLVVGGHVKSKDLTESMMIRSLDLTSMTWSVVRTKGTAPSPRGGHSATLSGDRLYVFGGEDVARRPLNDFFELNLESLEWRDLSSVKNIPPAARSAHVSISCLDRYLLFFGGGSVASCFDDLIVFDTERLRWHTAKVKGRKPSPRAGHSAAILDNHWYIVGGGNNASGCTDMAYLDLSQLNVWPSSTNSEEEDRVESLVDGPDLDDIDYTLQWTIVGTIPDRSYLASEGMSLISIQDATVLVAFGGYNGKYSNAVSLFRPRDETPVQPTLGLSPTKASEDNTGDRSNEEMDQKMQSMQAKLDAAAKNAAAGKEAASQEMAIMRRQLLSTQTLLQEKDSALNQCKTQLSNEQGKVLRLEAEVAELKIKLEKAAEMEKELNVYRHEKQMTGTKPGGIWGWVAGE